jgi:predicted transcriptional regulator
LVKTIEVEANLRQAALMMEQHNVGFLPVLKGTQLVGVITDRDIALRAAHFVLPFSAISVGEAMTPKVVTISDMATIAQAAETMAKNAVRRLVVVEPCGRISGILSLDDLAVYTAGDATVGQILQKIIKPTSQMHIGIDLGGDALEEGRFNTMRAVRAA